MMPQTEGEKVAISELEPGHDAIRAKGIGEQAKRRKRSQLTHRCLLRIKTDFACCRSAGWLPGNGRYFSGELNGLGDRSGKCIHQPASAGIDITHADSGAFGTFDL
ncbi:hypothetical protein SAMN05216420_102215 [Nitrosospira sp. Nl5]|nr:hypothetical protein SAMN05216420_102215 [Nitrosospira sp. Nl5]